MSNLYSYLENIYSKLSNYCVIICKDYPDDTEVINKSIPNSHNWYVSLVELCRKLDEGGGKDLRVVVLGLRKNR